MEGRIQWIYVAVFLGLTKLSLISKSIYVCSIEKKSDYDIIIINLVIEIYKNRFSQD